MKLTEKTLLTILKIKHTLYNSVYLIYGTVTKLEQYIPNFTNTLSNYANNIISNLKPRALFWIQYYLNILNVYVPEGVRYKNNSYYNKSIIYAPNCDSEANISNCFRNCTYLLKSDFVVTSKNQHISYLYAYCTNISDFRWEEWDLSNITYADFFLRDVPALEGKNITIDLNDFNRIVDGTFKGTISSIYRFSPRVKRIIGIEHALNKEGQILLNQCTSLEKVDGIENITVNNVGGKSPIGSEGFANTSKLICDVKINPVYPIITDIPDWLTFQRSGITGLDMSSFEFDYASNTNDFEVRNGFIFPKNKSHRGHCYMLQECYKLKSFKGEDRSLIQYSYVDKSNTVCYAYNQTHTPELLTGLEVFILKPHVDGSIRHSIVLNSTLLTNESIISIFNELVDWNSERYQVDYYNAIKDDMKDPSVYFSDITNGRHTIGVRKVVKNRITSDPELTHLIAQTANRGWVLYTKN